LKSISWIELVECFIRKSIYTKDEMTFHIGKIKLAIMESDS